MRALLLLVVVLAACGGSDPLAFAGCPRASPTLDITGNVGSGDAKTYRALPFEVLAGTRRVEVWYEWIENPGPPGSPASSTTLDLGLWDSRGYRNQDAFRGWGGSRQGRNAERPVYVENDIADRGFMPGDILPGTWYVDLGIAAVSTQGAQWAVHVRQCEVAPGLKPAADPVDATHVASGVPGWYHGDFHMHGFHSHPNGPEWTDFIAQSRASRLDFLMVTEYVTGRHWDTLGALQRAHPDLLIWPGREIITYFGHVNTHGETFGFHEYRHGFEDVSIADIQAQARAVGALFQVNHPTIFPPPTFSSFCRGCYFELGDEVDWNGVDTIEILTGPVRATAEDVGGDFPGQIENPFLQTAIDLWEDHLMQGHRITAVSGSDSKGVEPDETERRRRGYGSSATAVYASALTRAALTEALRAGRAYVRTRGVDGSPALEFEAAEGEQRGTFGATLIVGPTTPVTLTTRVTRGAGQMLRYVRNGEVAVEVPVTATPFVHTFTATRAPGEGPLGTFWRIETLDSETRTAIGNPIFLKGV